MLSPSFTFPEGARVACTGTFKRLTNPHAWIRARGGHPVVWSPRVTHVLVGSSMQEPSWKCRHPNITLLHETTIPPPAHVLWVDQYRPKRSTDILGHSSTIKELTTWLRDFGSATKIRAALLTGPPGIGKTTTAHLIAEELGYDVLEMNASDERSAAAVKAIVDRCARASNIQSVKPDVTTTVRKRLLIMDEVDGMSSGDRGGIAEIARICRSAAVAFPIVCIANDRQSPKIRPLASVALDIRFSRPTKTTIAKSLTALLNTKEGLQLRVSDVEDLCERNGNDIRSILNALQFLHDASNTGNGCGEKDAVLRMDPFSATGRVFGTSATLREREEAVFVDTGLVPLMVAEGYVSAAQKSRTANTVADQLEDVARAADFLSMWDMLDTRIHRQQAWVLLPAAVNTVVAAARTVDGPAPFQLFPTWLGKQSKRTKHRRLLGELRGHLRTPGDPTLMDTRDLLRARLFKAGLGPKERVAALDALGVTRDDMLETLVETVFKGDEASVALDTKAKSALTREWKKAHPTSTYTCKQGADTDNAEGADENEEVDEDADEDEDLE